MAIPDAPKCDVTFGVTSKLSETEAVLHEMRRIFVIKGCIY